MTKNELISLINSYDDKIGRWNICINGNSSSQFTIGKYYDASTNKWIVYQNAERGRTSEWKFETEEAALNKLYQRVKYRHSLISF